jgi:preprotein translocase subunit SecE
MEPMDQIKSVACFAALGVGLVTLLTAYLAQLRLPVGKRRLLPWLVSAVVILIFVVGRSVYGADRTPQAYVYWIGVLAAVAAGVIFMLPELREFLGQVREELRKVVWPSKEETQSFTLVVLVAVAVVAVFVGTLDMIFTQLTAWLKLYGER